jgi:hypothetical protein
MKCRRRTLAETQRASDMYTNATPTARYGVSLRVYLAINAVLLVGVCVFLWVLAGRADNHGISPNESLGFRSQSTLTSLHGWYVGQRVGFHFAAVAATLIVVAAFALVIVVFVRRRSPAWILLIPALAGLGIGLCMVAAGQRADKAATSVETAKLSASMTSDCSSDCPGQRVQIRYAVKSAGAATGDLKGEVPDFRSVLTLATRPA